MAERARGGSSSNNTSTGTPQRGIALLLHSPSVAMRYRLFLRVIEDCGLSPTVLLWSGQEGASSSARKVTLPGARVINLTGGASSAAIGRVKFLRQYFKTLRHAMDRISNEIEYIYATDIIHLLYFFFNRPKNKTLLYDALNPAIEPPTKGLRPIAPFISALGSRIERFLLKFLKVRGISVAAPRMEHLEALQKLSAEVLLIKTIPPMSLDATQQDREAFGNTLKGKKAVAIVGGMSTPEGLLLSFEMAKNIVDCYDDVFFLLIGKTWGTKESFKRMIKRFELEDDVMVLQGLAYPKMMACLENASVGLALQRKEGAAQVDDSLRLYSYMQARIPIVGPNFWEGARDAWTAQCGMFVDTTSPEDVSGAVAYLLTHPEEARQKGRNGREAFMKSFNWEREGLKLSELLKKVGV